LALLLHHHPGAGSQMAASCRWPPDLADTPLTATNTVPSKSTTWPERIENESPKSLARLRFLSMCFTVYFGAIFVVQVKAMMDNTRDVARAFRWLDRFVLKHGAPR
jgi:hypothetical protein